MYVLLSNPLKVGSSLLKVVTTHGQLRQQYNMGVGICDISAEQKILFVNATKWYEIWPRPKG
jgi:hypothetical protein